MYDRYQDMPTVRHNLFTEWPGGHPHRWPTAAVFDCDGLLVESSAHWERAFAATAKELGRSLTRAQLLTLLGSSVTSATNALSDLVGRVVDEDRLRHHLGVAFTDDAAPGLLRGVEAAVRRVTAHLPAAVATNGPRELVETVLKGAGLRHHFLHVVSAEDVQRPKPAPDVYLEACKRLRVDPSQAVAFEDSATGLTAARAAGLLTVGVHSHRPSRLEADLVVGRLDDDRVVSLLGLDT